MKKQFFANHAKSSAALVSLGIHAVRAGMGAKEYGVSTLGAGGLKNGEDLRVGKFEKQREWYQPTMLAMKQPADAVFLLTSWWGNQWHDVGERDREWHNGSAGRRWKEAYEEGKRLLAKENKERAAKGEPPRVIRNNAHDMSRVYFPDIERPPVPEKYFYQSRDYVEAMLEMRNIHRPKEVQAKSGLRKKRSTSKADFSFNVIHFRETGESIDTARHEQTEQRFRDLTGIIKGEYKSIAGLEAIKSSVSPEE